MSHFIDRRQQLAARYDALLAELPLQPLRQDNDRSSGYHLYVIRVADRDQVFARLREAGIGVNVHYMPIPAQPYYRNLGQDPADYPGAQAYYRQAISLPLFPRLSLAEQDRVIQTLERVLCA